MLNTINLQTILYKGGTGTVGILRAFAKWNTLTSILTVIILLESGYIGWASRSVNRFKPVDEDAELAFDSVTGQLCRTFGPRPRINQIRSALVGAVPSSSSSEKSDSKPDPILNAIRGGLSEAEFDKKVREDTDAKAEAQAQFIRGIPACADIR